MTTQRSKPQPQRSLLRLLSSGLLLALVAAPASGQNTPAPAVTPNDNKDDDDKDDTHSILDDVPYGWEPEAGEDDHDICYWCYRNHFETDPEVEVAYDELRELEWMAVMYDLRRMRMMVTALRP